MPKHNQVQPTVQKKDWRSWDDYPLVVIILILAALIPVVLFFTSSPYFHDIIKIYCQPEEIASRVATTTILAGAIIVTLYILVRKKTGTGHQAKWERLGLWCTAIFWILCLVWIFRTAELDENNQEFAGHPPVFTPIDSSRVWYTILATQNIEDSFAKIKYIAYPVGRPSYVSKTIDLAPGETWLYDLRYIEDDPNGSYSAVIESDRRVAAISIMEGIDAESPDSVLRLSYPGVILVDKKLYFPMVKNDYHGISTRYIIQNAADFTTKFRARFVMNDGKEYEYLSPKLKPGEGYEFSPEDAGVLPAVDEQGCIGSLIVEADQFLSGIAYEHSSNDLATIYSYTPAQTYADAYNSAYIPERGKGRLVNLHIINVDSAANDIRISYGMDGPSPACKKQTLTVPKHRLQPDAAFSTTQQEFSGREECWLWAKVEGTGKFLIFASEFNSDEKVITSLSYIGASEDFMSRNLAVPFFADHYKGIISTLHLRNMKSGKSAQFTASFHCTDDKGESYVLNTIPQNLEADSAYEFTDLGALSSILKAGQTINPNSWCSVIIQSDEPLIGYVLERSEKIGTNTRVNYDAFNIP